MSLHFIYFIILLLHFITYINSISISNYISISSHILPLCKICTLHPTSWMRRLPSIIQYNSNFNTTFNNDHISTNGHTIRDILYIPPYINLLTDRSFSQCCEDDHFCSLLCDHGFTVHVLGDFSPIFCRIYPI